VTPPTRECQSRCGHSFTSGSLTGWTRAPVTSQSSTSWSAITWNRLAASGATSVGLTTMPRRLLPLPPPDLKQPGGAPRPLGRRCCSEPFRASQQPDAIRSAGHVARSQPRLGTVPRCSTGGRSFESTGSGCPRSRGRRTSSANFRPSWPDSPSTPASSPRAAGRSSRSSWSVRASV